MKNIKIIKELTVKRTKNKPLFEKEWDFDFGNIKKHYIAVAKENVLAKFLSNCNGDKLCLNCFGNFQNEELTEKHKKFCAGTDYIDIVLPKKFKTVFANILKHLFGSKSFCQYVKIAFGFETMLVKLDETELKLEELRGKKDQSHTIKPHKHVPTGFKLKKMNNFV